MFAYRKTTQTHMVRLMSSKFPSNTIPGILKQAAKETGWLDLVRFNKYNWTVQEFDVRAQNC